MRLAPEHAGNKFADRAADRAGAEVRAWQRELDGCSEFEQPDAHAFYFGFRPPAPCDCPPGRCGHQPEVVRLHQRRNVRLRFGFGRSPGLPESCGHRRNGLTARGCYGCGTSRRVPLPLAA